MRRARHIHAQERMNRDLLSEAVLIGSLLLVLAFLRFVPLQAFS